MNETAIMAAANDVVGDGNWHGKKIFIAAVYEQIGAAKQGWTREEFGAELVRLHRADKLTLSRADLVEAMPRSMVELSEVAYLNATFHFIRIDR